MIRGEAFFVFHNSRCGERDAPGESMNRRDDTPARRMEDRDRLASWNAMYDRYSKLFTPAVLVAATWFVAHVWEPIQAVPQIQAQTKTLIVRDSVAMQERSDMKEALKILVRMQCLQLDAVDRAKIGLDCSAIPLADAEAVQRITRRNAR